MALVSLRINRVGKPPAGTPLRADGHWGAEGLIAAYPLNEAGGTIGLSTVAGGGPIVLSGCSFAGGRVRVLQGEISYLSTANPLIAGQAATFVFGGEITDALSGSNHGVFSVASSATESTPYILLRATSDGTMSWYFSSSGTVFSSPMQTRRPFVAALSYSVAGSLYTGCMDGKIVGSGAGNTDNLADNIYVGSGYNSSTGGDYDLLLIYARTLTRDELAAITINPWQVYEPETVWVDVPSGGGSVVEVPAAMMMGL